MKTNHSMGLQTARWKFNSLVRCVGNKGVNGFGDFLTMEVKIEVPTHIQRVSDQLKYGDMTARLSAVNELREEWYNAEAVPTLELALNDNSPLVRLSAVDILDEAYYRIGINQSLLKHRIIGSFIRGVSDSDPLVRLHSIDTLCCIAGVYANTHQFNQEAGPAIPVAKEALRDSDPDVRDCAKGFLQKHANGSFMRLETFRWKLYKDQLASGRLSACQS
jgi:hypothetical protein